MVIKAKQNVEERNRFKSMVSMRQKKSKMLSPGGIATSSPTISAVDKRSSLDLSSPNVAPDRDIISSQLIGKLQSLSPSSCQQQTLATTPEATSDCRMQKALENIHPGKVAGDDGPRGRQCGRYPFQIGKPSISEPIATASLPD